MADKELSDRALREKQREVKDKLEKEKEEHIFEVERGKFIKETIDRVKREFKNYEKGYRSFSIKIPQKQHYSIDGETIDLITNAVTKAYECDYRSLSLTEIIYPKSYTFIFYKPRKNLKKDLSKNL